MSRSLLKRLEEMAPDVAWTRPVPMRVYSIEGDPHRLIVGFLCRICVAQLGFRPASDHDRLFATEEKCLAHIADAHVSR